MPETFFGRPVIRHSPARVGKKIGHLMEKEGKPRKQAIAMALEMERHHRLADSGEYKPVKKGRKKMKH